MDGCIGPMVNIFYNQCSICYPVSHDVSMHSSILLMFSLFKFRFMPLIRLAWFSISANEFVAVSCVICIFVLFNHSGTAADQSLAKWQCTTQYTND